MSVVGFQHPPASASVVHNVGGCCPYCHQRTKGRWKIPVEVSILWPHRIECPQCHQKWDSTAHFNQDARRIVLAVMQENPDRINEMNNTPEQREWDTFMDDNIARRKDKQNWWSRKTKGRDWDPYDGLLSDFEKRYWTQIGGGSEQVEEERADDQEGDADGGAVGVGDASDGDELPGGTKEGVGEDRGGSDDD